MDLSIHINGNTMVQTALFNMIWEESESSSKPEDCIEIDQANPFHGQQ